MGQTTRPRFAWSDRAGLPPDPGHGFDLFTEGLGVSADGSLLCAGDRSGRLTCHAAGPLRPSTLFEAWRPKARRLTLALVLELPAQGRSCAQPVHLHLDLPGKGPVREQIAALSARGAIPLATLWRGD